MIKVTRVLDPNTEPVYSVDVIVPCYRYAHFLRQCVDSILSQVGVATRVLVIDDASPDNTADVATDLVKSDSRVTLVRHQTNRGSIHTFNEGLEWAQAEYLLLLSADDYLLPKALLRAATLMDVHPEVGFAFGRYVELREGALIKRPTVLRSVVEDESHIMSGIDFIRRSGPSNIVAALTAVVRTDVQKQVGGYRSEIPHTADMEMWLRLATRAAVGFIGSYQAVYRVHGLNMSLSYYLGSGLQDFEQRRDALRCFFDWSGERLPNAVRMRDEFYCALARQATGRASAAFNRGEMDECNELLEFALDTWRDIKKSSCWFKVALKRRMGLHAWRAIRTLLPR